MNLKKKPLIYLAINSIIIFFMTLAVVNHNYIAIVTNASDKLIILGYLSVLSLIYKFYTLYKITDVKYSLISIFIIVYYLFNQSQIILYSIGFVSDSSLFYRFSLTEMYISAYYSLFIVFLFHTGIILYYTLVKSEKRTLNVKFNNEIIYRAGKLLFIILLIPASVYYIVVFINALSLGYHSLFQSVFGIPLLDKILGVAVNLFLASLILLYVGSRGEAKWCKSIIIALAFYYLILGERTTGASLLLIHIWYQYVLKTKSSFKKVFFISAITVLIISFPVILTLRSEVITFSSFFKQFGSLDNSIFDLIFESVSQLGFSLFPLVHVQRIVPSIKGYALGESYFYSLLSIFPNIFGGTHIAAQKSSLGQWLMSTLNMNYGPGFSIPAEAYYNFGPFPHVIMIILGIIFARLLYIKKNQSNHDILFPLLFFFLSVTFPRREVLGLIRDVFYIIVPIYIILSILKKRKSGF